jgi:hypothetical protein
MPRYKVSYTYLNSDHDPLYRFHQWQANLRILDVEVIKTVPYVPLSSIRRTPDRDDSARVSRPHAVWTAADLEVKLLDFQRYFNGHRTQGWADAGTAHWRGQRTGECQEVSLAAAL